jgi:hypothetical protein
MQLDVSKIKLEKLISFLEDRSTSYESTAAEVGLSWFEK